MAQPNPLPGHTVSGVRRPPGVAACLECGGLRRAPGDEDGRLRPAGSGPVLPPLLDAEEAYDRRLDDLVDIQDLAQEAGRRWNRKVEGALIWMLGGDNRAVLECQPPTSLVMHERSAGGILFFSTGWSIHCIEGDDRLQANAATIYQGTFEQWDALP